MCIRWYYYIFIILYNTMNGPRGFRLRRRHTLLRMGYEWPNEHNIFELFSNGFGRNYYYYNNNNSNTLSRRPNTAHRPRGVIAGNKRRRAKSIILYITRRVRTTPESHVCYLFCLFVGFFTTPHTCEKIKHRTATFWVLTGVPILRDHKIIIHVAQRTC